MNLYYCGDVSVQRLGLRTTGAMLEKCMHNFVIESVENSFCV